MTTITSIIRTEFMLCKTCGKMSIHEIKIDPETKTVRDVICYRCKYNDEDMYKMFETMHDGGVRFSLGIKNE